MRRLFTTEQARRDGISQAARRWGVRTGSWRRVRKGIYAYGSEEPTVVDIRRARVMALGGVADGHLAGVIHGLDGIVLDDRPPRRRRLLPERICDVAGMRCTDALQTLVDLAATLGDDKWEQALESVLRRRLVCLTDFVQALVELSRSRAPGTARIRRVLATRGPVPPTESLLETLMVQLLRRVPGLEVPTRQLEVVDRYGRFVARVDLAWPELGLFIELDGQHHRHQPVYDARRETAVVAATDWLCGRFTWSEVVHVPNATARRVDALVAQARRRPVASM